MRKENNVMDATARSCDMGNEGPKYATLTLVTRVPRTPTKTAMVTISPLCIHYGAIPPAKATFPVKTALVSSAKAPFSAKFESLVIPAVMGENRELSSIGQKRKKKMTSEMQCRRDG